MNCPRIKANYSFWRHPIKWVKEYKIHKLTNLLLQSEWKNGMEEKVIQATLDAMIYGRGYIKNDNHNPVSVKDLLK